MRHLRTSSRRQGLHGHRSDGRRLCCTSVSRSFLFYILSLLVVGCSFSSLCEVPLAEAAVVETKLIGIDLGSQYVKTAAQTITFLTPTTSTPETKMVLNDQTNRKSPSCLALRYVPHWTASSSHLPAEEEETESESNAREEQTESEARPSRYFTLERAFAEPADALLYRFPTQTICHPLQFLWLGSSCLTTTPFSSEDSEAEEDTSKEKEKDKEGEGHAMHRRTHGRTLSRYYTTYTFPHPHRAATAMLIPYTPSEPLLRGSARTATPPTDSEWMWDLLSSSLHSFSPHRSPLERTSKEEEKRDVSKSLRVTPSFSAFTTEEIIGMFFRASRRLGEKEVNSINRVSESVQAKLMKKKAMKSYVEAWESEKETEATSADPKAVEHDELHHSTPSSLPTPPSAPIRYAVLAIPSGLSVAARQSLLDAGAIAGLRVTRLLHSTTAAVYQLFHLKGEDFIELLKSTTSRRSKLFSDSKEDEDDEEENGSESEKGKGKKKKKNPLFGKTKDGSFPTSSAAAAQRKKKSSMRLEGEEGELYLMVYELGYQWAEASVFAISAVSPSVQMAAEALQKARAQRWKERSTDTSTRNGEEGKPGGFGSQENTAEEEEGHGLGFSTSSSTSSHVRIRRVSTARSAALGGHAFDRCIAEYWDRTYFDGRILGSSSSPTAPASEWDVATPWKQSVEQQKDRLALLRAAEAARERLSVNKVTPVHIERLSSSSSSSSSFSTTFTTELLEQQCQHLLQDAVNLARDAWDTVDALYGPTPSASNPRRASHTTEEEHDENHTEDETEEEEEEKNAPYSHPRLERVDVVGAAARMPAFMAALATLPTQLSRRPLLTSTSMARLPPSEDRRRQWIQQEKRASSRVEEGNGVPVGLRQSLNADEAVVLGAVGFATTHHRTTAPRSSSTSAAASPTWMPGTSWIQEVLTNNIYTQVSIPPLLSHFRDEMQEDEDVEKVVEQGPSSILHRSPLQLVFEKDYTILPAMYSVIIPPTAITGPFVFSLYSPPASSYALTSPAALAPERMPSTMVFPAGTAEGRPISSHETEMDWLSTILDRFYEEATAMNASTTTTTSASSLHLPPDTFARHYVIRDVHLIRHTIKAAVKREEVSNSTFQRTMKLDPSSLRVVVQVRVNEDGIPEVHQAYMEASWTAWEKYWKPAVEESVGAAVSSSSSSSPVVEEEITGEGEEEAARQAAIPSDEPSSSSSFSSMNEEPAEEKGTWIETAPRTVQQSFLLGVLPASPRWKTKSTSREGVESTSAPSSRMETKKEEEEEVEEMAAPASFTKGSVPIASLVIPHLTLPNSSTPPPPRRSSSSTTPPPPLTFNPDSFHQAHVEAILPIGANMDLQEVLRSRRRLDELDKDEELQREHTHLRNELESMMLSIRTSSVWDTLSTRFPSFVTFDAPEEDATFATKEEEKSSGETGAVETIEKWYKEVAQLSEWLESEGEEASFRELTLQFKKGKTLKEEMNMTIASLLSSMAS